MKAHIFNRIVLDTDNKSADFYLTKSPFCSSSLEPDLEKLKNWNFYDKFVPDRKTNIKAITPQKALADTNIDYVDWFKTDSQGCDLRLFNALGEKITNRIIVADFEPGIIDSYKGEDKLHTLMAYMEKTPFWVSDLKIEGSQRINRNIKGKYWNKMGRATQEALNIVITSSPVCGEITYLNKLNNDKFSKRGYLLAWIFAIIKCQYGFALEIADTGSIRFGDNIFSELIQETITLMEKEAKKKLIRQKIKKALRKLKLRR